MQVLTARVGRAGLGFEVAVARRRPNVGVVKARAAAEVHVQRCTSTEATGRDVRKQAPETERVESIGILYCTSIVLYSTLLCYAMLYHTILYYTRLY